MSLVFFIITTFVAVLIVFVFTYHAGIQMYYADIKRHVRYSNQLADLRIELIKKYTCKSGY